MALDDQLGVDSPASFEGADEKLGEIGWARNPGKQSDADDGRAGERPRGRIGRIIELTDAASTTRRVAGRTPVSPLITRDTVIRDTPAWRATS
jgi:hypothetical protein